MIDERAADSRQGRNIEDEFAQMQRIMSSESFRNGEGNGGELNFYIYDYPCERQIEVEEQVRKLARSLQSTPVSDGGYAPRVLTIDLYETSLAVLKEMGVLDAVLDAEDKQHDVVSASVRRDSFLMLLDSLLGPDSDDMPNAIRAQFRAAKDKDGVDILFITGIGKVYPYIRAHALLDKLQSQLDDRPVVLFYPGTYAVSSEAGSTMSLFGCLPADNYYRAASLRLMMEDVV